MKTEITLEDRERVIRLRHEGDTQKMIVLRSGLTIHAVEIILREAGLSYRRPCRREVKVMQIKKITRM